MFIIPSTKYANFQLLNKPLHVGTKLTLYILEETPHRKKIDLCFPQNSRAGRHYTGEIAGLFKRTSLKKSCFMLSCRNDRCFS